MVGLRGLGLAGGGGRWGAWRGWGCLLPGVLFFCCGAGAGEDVPTQAPDPFQDVFTFQDEGWRDPFTFAKAEAAKVPGRAPGQDEDRDVLIDMQQKMDNARRLLAQAKELFKQANSAEAVEYCARGFEELKSFKEDHLDAGLIREDLGRMRKAAERVRLRKEAEQAFRRFNIRISGIVRQDRDAAAIINGKLLYKGQTIALSESEELPPRIMEIRPHAVLVLFRSFQMEVPVLP